MPRARFCSLRNYFYNYVYLELFNVELFYYHLGLNVNIYNTDYSPLHERLIYINDILLEQLTSEKITPKLII